MRMGGKQEQEMECPECEAQMKFIETKRKGRHGLCDKWACPKCGEVVWFDECGDVLED